MQQTKDVKQDVELMCSPEELVRLPSYDRVREDEDDAHDNEQHYASQTC